MGKDKPEKKDKKDKKRKESKEGVDEPEEVAQDVEMVDAEPKVSSAPFHLSKSPPIAALLSLEIQKRQGGDRDTNRGSVSDCPSVGTEKTPEKASQNYQERYVRFSLRTYSLSHSILQRRNHGR